MSRELKKPREKQSARYQENKFRGATVEQNVENVSFDTKRRLCSCKKCFEQLCCYQNGLDN